MHHDIREEREEEARVRRRQQLLSFAIQTAVAQKETAKLTSEAANDLLNDKAGPWSPEALASLENSKYQFKKEAEEWDATIDEGFLMLNEFERANGLPLSGRMEGKI